MPDPPWQSAPFFLILLYFFLALFLFPLHTFTTVKQAFCIRPFVHDSCALFWMFDTSSKGKIPLLLTLPLLINLVIGGLTEYTLVFLEITVNEIAPISHIFVVHHVLSCK